MSLGLKSLERMKIEVYYGSFQSFPKGTAGISLWVLLYISVFCCLEPRGRTFSPKEWRSQLRNSEAAHILGSLGEGTASPGQHSLSCSCFTWGRSLLLSNLLFFCHLQINRIPANMQIMGSFTLDIFWGTLKTSYQAFYTLLFKKNQIDKLQPLGHLIVL